MSDLSARLRRLLFLVPYVARRADGVRINDLANELAIDRQQLITDLEVLTQVGPPGGDPGEYLLVTVARDRVYVDLAQRLTRPLRLTPAEGCALLVGLHALRHSGIAPYDDALFSAERKLLAALGVDAAAAQQLAEGTFVATQSPLVAANLPVLLAAARRRRKVAIEYSSASSGRSESRTVEPYGIVMHAGNWYMVGCCCTRGDTRTFRVDRIAAIEEKQATFTIPESFDLDAYRRERLYVPSADAVAVRARLDSIAVARVGSAWPTGTVTKTA
ncbi:MAG: WYL domain-containing protein, partial [Pseudomonadota bacterium]